MEQGLERVWEGRLHLGDEPGVYGDAAYVGLAVELPISLHRIAAEKQDDERVEIVVEAYDVHVFDGCSGHAVTVQGFFADPAAEPEWHARVLAAGRLVEDTVTIVVEGDIPSEVSVRVEVDTDAGPGLYDDFVLRRISIRSRSHHASLGFRFV